MRQARLMRMLSWAFALSVIGYPLAGLLAVFVNVPSWVTSYPFRVLVAVLSFTLFCQASALRRRGQAHALIFLFWLLYSLRLMWDSLMGPPGAAEALFYFTLTVAIPVAALMRASVHWDEVYTAKVVFYMGSAICGAGLLLALGFVSSDRILSDITTQLFLDTVNPITFSHTAVTTLLAAVALLYGNSRTVSRGILTAGMMLAVGCMVQAASRGPLLALVACAVLAAISQNRWLLLGLLVALVGAVVMSSAELELLTRFADLKDLGTDPSSAERVVLMANAMQMFEQNPVFGAAYAELELNTYPHNLFVETAMALGVVGLLPLVAMTLLCFWNAWRLLRRGQMLVPLLFIQYFIGFQVSSALWGAAAYWACTGLLLCASFPIKGLKAPASARATPFPNPAT